ncbi:MAG TPA: FMN-binding protein [Candidatus Binatia bacterium]
MRAGLRTILGFVATVALVLAGATVASAKVHYARNEALQLAFPGADRVESKNFFLTDEEQARVEELAKAPLESQLVTVHVGEKDGAPMGYAFIDTHIVRTLPETLLIVVAPDGSVAKLLLLAFYEPPDFEPSERWLEQFPNRKLDPAMRVDRDIHGIAGATLTSHAVTSAVRRALALHQVLIEKK